MVVAMKEVGALKPTNSYQAALSAKSGSSASHKSLVLCQSGGGWVVGESAHWGIVACACVLKQANQVTMIAECNLREESVHVSRKDFVHAPNLIFDDGQHSGA